MATYPKGLVKYHTFVSPKVTYGRCLVRVFRTVWPLEPASSLVNPSNTEVGNHAIEQFCGSQAP